MLIKYRQMENMNNIFLIIAFPDFIKLVSIKNPKNFEKVCRYKGE